MAQKKLLLILKIILLFTFIDVGFCASHIEQLTILREKNLNALKKLLSNSDAESDEDASLYLFVSSSMPKSLLRNYYNEAYKYNATLVLNGLPKSSFLELSDFVREISNSEQNVPIIIDDESYKRFNITKVPSFVLFESENCLNDEVCDMRYDKVVGNIGIKKALEMFYESGDLPDIAERFLR